MKIDTMFAGALIVAFTAYLLQKKLGSVIVWFALAIAIARYAFKLPNTLSAIAGVITVLVISMVTAKTWEGFEDEVPIEDRQTEQPKKSSKPSPAPPKTDDPHLDVGTTILHAYRNLSPEQIGGMRRDTRELLQLQKELMGSLSEMKPAIEQGAELLKTFSTFFGDQGKQ
jgi:hypothetical protein